MDWIKARVECTAGRMWLELRSRLAADLKEWENYTSVNGRPKVEYDSGNKSLSATRVDERGMPEATIRVELVPTAIEWEKPDGSKQRLTWSLDAENRCRIVHQGRHLDYWEVSKLMLESILFPS